jgi:hypothetical protein
MNNYYVYMYLREDGTPYYVGKGKDYRAYHRTTHGLVVLPPADRIKKVLQGLTEEQAFRNEADFIAWYGRLDNNTGILENRTDGGDGISGYKHTKETKERLRQSSTGRYYSEETRKKISDNNKGLKRSEEIKKKMSEDRKGKRTGQVPWNKGKTYSYAEDYVPWNKGKKLAPFSEDTIKKMSEAAKKRIVTEETRKKMAMRMKGQIPWNKGIIGWVRGHRKDKVNIVGARKPGTLPGVFYINNGVDNIRLNPTDIIPDGWIKGRLPRKKKWVLSEETKKKIGNSNKGKLIDSIYINNGTENRRIQKDVVIPDGWVKGKLSHTKCNKVVKSGSNRPVVNQRESVRNEWPI